MTIAVGMRVEKRRGYRWPGVVVAVFKTLAGETRVVVECTVPEVAGALHIYAPKQVRAQKRGGNNGRHGVRGARRRISDRGLGARYLQRA